MRRLLAFLIALLVMGAPTGERLRADDLMLLLGSNGTVNTAPPPTSCSTTEQFALNPTPNGCNLVLFTQGSLP
jgi:hypothetical protein